MSDSNADTGEGTDADNKTIGEQIELADAHIEKAENELADVANRVQNIVAKTVRVDASANVSDQSIDVELDYSETRDELVERLPEGYGITTTGAGICIQYVGTPEEQRERIASIKRLIKEVDGSSDEPGAPLEDVIQLAASHGIDEETTTQEINKLRERGDIYSPATDQFKVV